MKTQLVKQEKRGLSTQARNWRVVGLWAIVLAFTLPIFRSGGRGNLTFFDWIKEHSIYGSPIQYVPEEDYMAELGGE